MNDDPVTAKERGGLPTKSFLAERIAFWRGELAAIHGNPAFTVEAVAKSVAGAAILSRLRDDTATARFKTIAEYRSWVIGVETP